MNVDEVHGGLAQRAILASFICSTLPAHHHHSESELSLRDRIAWPKGFHLFFRLMLSKECDESSLTYPFDVALVPFAHPIQPRNLDPSHSRFLQRADHSKLGTRFIK